MSNAYNTVASVNLQTRLTRGFTANIELAGEESGVAYVRKSFKSGMCEHLLENEIYWLRELHDLGLTPNLHPDYLEDDYGDILMQRINLAASLGDYCEAYLGGEIEASDLKAIFIATQEVLEAWSVLGLVHNDLHADNICITCSPTTGWRAYVIDLSWSYPEGDLPDWIDYERSWNAYEFDDDLQYLVKDLLNRGEALQEFVNLLEA